MHLFERMILLGGENHFLKKTKLVDSKLTLDLKSDFDYYHYACTKSYCSLSTALDKARMSIKLIDFKYIAIIDGEKYPAHSYVELFIENSIIRIQSIYDRVLIFVNKLLELGISNESINHNILVTNENVIKYGFDKKLKVLNKKFG